MIKPFQEGKEAIMGEMTRARNGEFTRKVSEILIDHPEGLQAKDVLQKIEDSMELTDFEKGNYEKTNIRRFDKIVRFLTIKMVKAGWLLKLKGKWILTEEGRKAYYTYQNSEEFDAVAWKLYRQWKQGQPSVEEEPEEGNVPPVASTVEEAEETAWEQIQGHIRSLSPYDFQDLFAGLLKAMGYHVAFVAPPGKDDGLDIIAYSDPLGTQGPRIKAQVKHRESPATVDEIRSFLSLVGNSDVGIFLSSGGFTKDAESKARAQEQRHITLLDLEKLYDLWVEHYQKIDQTSKNLLPLKTVYFLAPKV